MTKKINKETSGKEEFLKRLETGSNGGFDDFEKEALEGFAELKNTGLSEQLIKDLDKRIDEAYFKEPTARPKWIWYSMAAGLLLVIGLSFYFVNDFTRTETNLAYAKDEIKDPVDKLKDEVNSESQPAPPPNAETKGQAEKVVVTEEADRADYKKSAEDSEPGRKQNSHAASGPVETSPRMVAKESKKEPAPDKATSNGQAVPLTVAATTFEQKPQTGKRDADKDASNAHYGDDLKKAEEKSADNPTAEQEVKLAQIKSARANDAPSKKEKTVEKNKKDDEAPSGGLAENESVAMASGSSANAPATMEAPKNKAKEQREEAGSEGAKALHDESMAKGSPATAGGASGENSLRRSAYFKTAAFDNHDAYFRKEIEKNKHLKAELLNYGKAFRIDITIGEKGKVSDTKVDLPVSCSECKTTLEKIILRMPFWQPAQSPDGRPVKQTFYFNYKY